MKDIETVLNLRQILLDRRDALRRSLEGELSLLGNHEDDDDSCDEGLFSRLSRSESVELRAIDQALDSLREGRYGRCEDCGRNIPLPRLRAVPYAALCIECQRQAEGSYGNVAALRR